MDGDEFNLGWFSDPLRRPQGDDVRSLRTIPTSRDQRDALVAILTDVWPSDKVGPGPVLGDDGTPNPTLQWLEVPGLQRRRTSDASARDDTGDNEDESPASLYVVTEKTAQTVSLGLGLRYRYEPGGATSGASDAQGRPSGRGSRAGAYAAAQLTIEPFAYLPLAGMAVTDSDYFVLGTERNPLWLGIDVHVREKSLLAKLPESLAPYDGLRVRWSFVFRPQSERPSCSVWARPKDTSTGGPPYRRLEAPSLDAFIGFLLRLPDFPDIDLTGLLQALLTLRLPSFPLPGLPHIRLRLDEEVGVEFQLQDIDVSSRSGGSRSATKKAAYDVRLQLGEAFGAEDATSWVGTRPGVKVRLGWRTRTAS